MKQEQTRPKADGQTGARTDRSGRLPAPPPARYACSRKSCRHGRTHRPEDILWHEGEEGAANEAGNIKRPATDAGWYCVRCAADLQIAPKAPKLDEVLRAEGHDVPDAESRSNPACADCAFYGLNAKASTNAASRELLEDTHGIDDADCCHPASLIMRGNGVYDRARGMRYGWCGPRGRLFTPWPRRQRQQAVQARVLAVRPIMPIGWMQRVQIALEGDGGREIECLVGATTVREAGLAPGSRCTAALSHRPDGDPVLDDWRAAEAGPDTGTSPAVKPRSAGIDPGPSPPDK